MALEKTNLLLVGRTGNGKSATGNSILGRKVFNPEMSREIKQNGGNYYSVEYNPPCVEKGESETNVDGESLTKGDVTVVDGSGIGDTETEFPCYANNMIGKVKNALCLLDNQFTALLVLMRYKDPFIKWEINTVKVIKSIFGPNVISNYGIIIITRGDKFEADMEDNEITFEGWCGSQEGEIQSILQECNQRCVLFNNMTKDPDKLREQYEKLMIKVNEIKSLRRPYNETDFDSAMPGRNKLLMMNTLPEFEEKIKIFIDNVTMPRKEYSNENRMRRLKELKKLLRDMIYFRRWLLDQDEETGFLKIYCMCDNLNYKIQSFECEISEIENMVQPKSLSS